MLEKFLDVVPGLAVSAFVGAIVASLIFFVRYYFWGADAPPNVLLGTAGIATVLIWAGYWGWKIVRGGNDTSKD